MPVNTSADPAEHTFRLVRWIRLHLSGRSVVDPEQLKFHAQSLTEQQWALAVREPIPQRTRNENSTSKQPDLETIPDGHPSASDVLYLQEILSILERNLMSDEVPYLRALLNKTPVKTLAVTLGAKPSTVWARMNRVRKKAQEIIIALGRGDSS
jgi:hypothetical protein